MTRGDLPGIVLERRADLTLDSFARAAWGGSPVAFSHAAVDRMTAAREAFLRLIEDPNVVVYGVTSGYGQMAKVRFTPEERKRHAAKPPLASNAAFGRPAPDRIARGIVFARLANFIEGHAAISPPLAQAVAAMLALPSLPPLPIDGHGGAGEITILSPLFRDVARAHDLAEKDMLALVNGSPAATALLADQALAGRRRLSRAIALLTLSAEALKAPIEAYDDALDDLWNDPDDAAVLREMRRLMAGGSAERRPYQAPVSFRIAPRLLGNLHRAVTRAEIAAGRMLAAVTDNPVFLAPAPIHPDPTHPAPSHPNGRVLSNGGFQGAACPPALDAITAAYADLAQIAERQAVKILDGALSGLPDQLMSGWPEDERYLGCLGMSAVGWAERAKVQCAATLLPGSESGGFGANDVASPVFLAWEKTVVAGDALDATLAILAVVASQALHVTGRPAPPALAPVLDQVRETAPPIDSAVPPGPHAGGLAELYGTETYRL